VLDTISELVGKFKILISFVFRARKTYLSGESYGESQKVVVYTGIISRVDERRKWKKVNNEEGGIDHRRLKKELKRASGKAKKKCLESLCGEIVEFQRTGLYDLTY